MITRMHCINCGTTGLIPLDSEDAQDGWQIRAVWLKGKKPTEHFAEVTNVRTGEKTRTDFPHLICDHCNAKIEDGAQCVAITMWRGEAPADWESGYGELTPEQP